MLEGTGATAASARKVIEVRRRLIQALQAAGAGLPYQALETGTRNVAEFLGTRSETGTIAAGRRADLVLLDSDPLADIRNTTRRTGVMLGGRWLSKSEIDVRLAAVAKSTGNN